LEDAYFPEKKLQKKTAETIYYGSVRKFPESPGIFYAATTTSSIDIKIHKLLSKDRHKFIR